MADSRGRADRSGSERLRTLLRRIDRAEVLEAVAWLSHPEADHIAIVRTAAMIANADDLTSAATKARSIVRGAGYDVPSSAEILLSLSNDEIEMARSIAKRGDRYVGRDFAPDVSAVASLLGSEEVPFSLADAQRMRTFADWARRDLQGGEMEELVRVAKTAVSSDADDDSYLGQLYYGYLAALWWRAMVVAAAVHLASRDESQAHEPHALPSLPAETLRSQVAPAEAFLGAVIALIDQPESGLSIQDENLIRSHLNSLRGYYAAEGAIPRILIQKPIEEIVKLLADRLVLGDEARVALRALGASPPQVVDDIVDAMNRAIRSISGWDAQDDFDVESETAQLLETQVALDELEAAFEGVALAEHVDPPADPAAVPPVKLRLRDEFLKAFAVESGKKAAVGVMVGVPLLAVATHGSATSVAARLVRWLVEFIPGALG